MVVAEDGQVGAHRRQRDMRKGRVAAAVEIAFEGHARAACGIVFAAVHACNDDRLCVRRRDERLAERK